MEKTFKVEVYYEDTDFSGAVYHANYFKFIERARSHLIATLEIDQLKLLKNDMMFVVRSVSATFLKPAHFGDCLDVKTAFLRIGSASIQLEQKVLKSDECLFVAVIKIGLISKGRPTRFPEVIREKLLNKDRFSN